MAVDQGTQTGVILTTALATFITGWLFGLYTTRGYLISPALAEERRRNFSDPVESEESDIDEDDTILDHAPNWTNGEDADNKQGLRSRARVGGLVEKTPLPMGDSGNANEECKLVLVVRTDLGMTKGTHYYTSFPPVLEFISMFFLYIDVPYICFFHPLEN